MTTKLPAPAFPAWLERMLPTGVARYVLDLGAHQVHVMEVGEGRPVLCLHGNPSWGFLYRKVAAELAGAGFRVIMPDLVGLGFSDKPRDAEVHTLEGHIQWMGQVIDALDLREAIFVGQDWGGPIGLGAFVEREHRLAGMVVLNTVVGPPKKGFKATAFHRFARAPLVSDVVFRVLGFPQNLMTAAQGDKRSILGAARRAYVYPLRRIRDRAAPLAMARMVPDSFAHASITPLERCQGLFEHFQGPIAVVWGDRDPVLGSVRSWVEKLRPDAEVTRTDAGHFLQEEVPAEIAAAIRSVAERIGRRRATGS